MNATAQDLDPDAISAAPNTSADLVKPKATKATATQDHANTANPVLGPS